MIDMEDKSRQFWNQEELAKAWHCSPRVIGLLTKYGMLHPIRAGRSYVFNLKDIDKLFETYGGYDLSNEEKIRLAKQITGPHTRNKKEAES